MYADGLEKFGVKQAEKYYDDIFKQFARIAETPKLYPLRHGLPTPARVCPYKSHIILYKQISDDILIVRIRHNREDWLLS